MKQETMTYKVVCNLNDNDFYTDSVTEATETFERYKQEYGDGIRLYEAIKTTAKDDAPEWDILDYYDEEPKDTSTRKDELSITKGEWVVDDSIEHEVSIVSPWNYEHRPEHSATFGDYRGGIISTAHWNTGVPTHAQALANAKAICTAVNSTYGKGYNPAAMEELYKALEEITDMALRWSVKGLTPTIHTAQTALNNAKI